jgi:hypothetical protein
MADTRHPAELTPLEVVDLYFDTTLPIEIAVAFSRSTTFASDPADRPSATGAYPVGCWT